MNKQMTIRFVQLSLTVTYTFLLSSETYHINITLYQIHFVIFTMQIPPRMSNAY